MEEHAEEFSVKKMAELLQVSKSGYYDWLKRNDSQRDQENERIYHDIIELFLGSRKAAGARRIAHELSRLYKRPINRKRVARLMRIHGLLPKNHKKHVVTTNSKNSSTIFPNLLQREFTATAKNQKLVSDTTYIWTEEGWLYLAAIMDLYGRKIVGMAISDHNDQALVLAALEDAKNRIGRKNLKGCILHSDRGSTYASKEYIRTMEAYGLIGSMSRTGNCWDNAPIESFWGRMKMEWIQPYRTKEEAIDDIYEYIWAYYNRKRVHSSNGYCTPEEYYSAAAIA